MRRAMLWLQAALLVACRGAGGEPRSSPVASTVAPPALPASSELTVPPEMACTTPPVAADYAVLFDDEFPPGSRRLVLLEHREVCGDEPDCPNALVTYGSGR